MSSPAPEHSRFACSWWPWRLAAASYICLPLAVMLSLAHVNVALLLPANLAFSACCLLGLTLLVAAFLSALFALSRPNIIDFFVLLVTLPPLALHVWGLIERIS